MERFCHRQELVPNSCMSGTLLRITCRGVLGSNRVGSKSLPCLVGPRPLSHPFTSASPLSRLGWRGCKAAAPATEAAHVVDQPDSNGAFKSTAYPFTEIENKWQAFWEEHQTFRTPEFKDLDTSKPKFYALDMFPYPR
jgi:hypothetical protein